MRLSLLSLFRLLLVLLLFLFFTPLSLLLLCRLPPLGSPNSFRHSALWSRFLHSRQSPPRPYTLPLPLRLLPDHSVAIHLCLSRSVYLAMNAPLCLSIHQSRSICLPRLPLWGGFRVHVGVSSAFACLYIHPTCLLRQSPQRRGEVLPDRPRRANDAHEERNLSASSLSFSCSSLPPALLREVETIPRHACLATDTRKGGAEVGTFRCVSS